jgi:hypothetical protein
MGRCKVEVAGGLVCWVGGRCSVGVIFNRCYYLLIGRIWGYVCRCMFHSFAIYYHLNHMYKIARVYSISVPSLLYELCPCCLPLFRRHGPCLICVERILMFVHLLYGTNMLLTPILQVRPVCPTYFNGHSLHFNWYTPDFKYTSVICFFYVRCFCIVLLVFKAIPMFVFLNSLDIILVSVPWYVKVAHFSVFVSCCFFDF